MAPRPRNTGSKDLPPNLYRKTDARNGVTYYTYRDPVSGRVFGLGKDKEAAIREAVAANHADAIKPTLTDRISAPVPAPGKLFSEWLVEYRELFTERKLSASSNKNVGMRINRLDAVFGSKGIKDITTMDVADYLTGMAKEGKAQMARAMRSLLRDVFVEAMARGWVGANPVEVTKAARVNIKRERLTLELWKANIRRSREAVAAPRDGACSVDRATPRRHRIDAIQGRSRRFPARCAIKDRRPPSD